MRASYGFFAMCLLCVCCMSSMNSAATFMPVDSFFITCGGSKALELDDGRVFQPDFGNPSVSLSSPSHQNVVLSTKSGMSNESILYHSARVFRQTSTYTVKTRKTGRHWLRLHFFLVENPHFNLKSAVFSVVANGITLLHGFSFSHAVKESRLVMEYVVEVGGSSSKNLVLALSPWNGSVAFINGIEVVSVPDGLFPSRVVPIPLGPEVNIPDHVAFQTAYRINMGAPLLEFKYDSLRRVWESDIPFLVNAGAAKNVSAYPSSIEYPVGTSDEVAPNWVYATAQEMADANVIDQRFNISWSFDVDRGFTYLVRMHFCDIISKRPNSLAFNVYIDKQSALNSFDISSKSTELPAAYFIDFIANASVNSNRILVQVGPTDLRNFPPNAILNGLEIMKISNPLDSLDGKLHGSYNDANKSKKTTWLVLAVSVSSAGFAVLIVIVAAAFFLYPRHETKPKDPPSPWMSIPAHVGYDSKLSIVSFDSESNSFSLGRVLSFSEISEATKNFDESLVLGVGGFGKVYQGVLENGMIVAVKRGNPRSQQGMTEFRTEIEMLSKFRHGHLVSLIGYCDELNEMILVYEFMAGGPLRKHLYGSSLPLLTWKQRLEICIGAAKGLHYLHTGASEVIIHRDVKTTNILLDETLTAKVADFGLSKFGPTLDQTHVSTAVKGSFGYLDPEYFRRQQLTEKSDVYSFGVVLLEVLCARPAINPALPREQVNIAEWAMGWQKRGQLERIIDPHLAGNVNLESLRKFGETAKKCLAEYGTDRPTMGDVLWNLEYALQLHVSSTQNVLSSENSASYIPDIPDWIQHIQAVDGEGDGGDSASEVDQNDAGTTTTGVFSQLISPRGR